MSTIIRKINMKMILWTEKKSQPMDFIKRYNQT